MAKKDLASLMNGIMGSQKSDDNVNKTIMDDVCDEPEVGRKNRVGRPRKGETVIPVNEVRATFIVNPEVVRKIKYISLVEGSLLKEVIGEALGSYVKNWESVNGKINLPKAKI